MSLTAELVDPILVPGSPEWRREITASKVSAILGLSPWTSRFSIYYELANMVPHDDEMTVNQARGHWLEDAIGQWFANEFGVHLRPGLCWRSKTNPWMVASPDKLVVATPRSRTPRAVVEIKTAGDYGDWGPDGTDEIPPYYRVQIVFQMDTLGLPIGYAAVLLPRLTFRAYTIHHDQDEAAWIRQEVLNFLATLPGGPNETPPSIDEHDSTYETLRKMHGQIEDRDVEVDSDLAWRFVQTMQDAKRIKDAKVGLQSEMAQVMGTAKRAVLLRPGQDPLVIATRTSKGAGNPYVAAPRTLPSLEELLV